MNCKPGDLAVYVRSGAMNLGRIVEVIRFAGEHPIFEGRRWCRGSGPCWVVRSSGSPLSTSGGDEFMVVIAPDAFLRPIRPPSQEDETETVKEMESV